MFERARRPKLVVAKVDFRAAIAPTFHLDKSCNEHIVFLFRCYKRFALFRRIEAENINARRRPSSNPANSQWKTSSLLLEFNNLRFTEVAAYPLIISKVAYIDLLSACNPEPDNRRWRRNVYLMLDL